MVQIGQVGGERRGRRGRPIVVLSDEIRATVSESWTPTLIIW